MHILAILNEYSTKNKCVKIIKVSESYRDLLKKYNGNIPGSY